MIELMTTMNRSAVGANVLKVICVLLDKSGQEYDLWVDGEDFAVARDGYRSVPMRLNLENLAAFCWQNQLAYKLEDDLDTEPMFQTLHEIVRDVKEEEDVCTCRVVHMEELKVYIYLKAMDKFTDIEGHVLLDVGEMPKDGLYFLEPYISETWILGCHKETMTERVIWLREILLKKELIDFASELDIPLNLYVPFEAGTFHSPLVFQKIMDAYPWIDEKWLSGNR